MRRLTTIVAALALALGLAVGAPAAAHADNTAIAVNTTDGSSVFKFAFAIKHVMSSVVDETNAAVAYSQCTDCRTTAIAIEIVLVEGNPTTFTPTNAAVAVNYQCTLCNTFAAAYQFVVQGSGPMHFTHQAMRELRSVRRAIRELEDQNLDPFPLQAALDPLIARIQNVLTTGLVSGPIDDDENDNQDRSSDGARPPNHAGDKTETSTGPAATATVPADTTTGTDTTQTTPAPTTTDTTTTAPAPTTTDTTTTTTTTPTDTSTTTTTTP
ncbi:MAG: putative peptide zinc metalloprotease protein [Gaiellaceae bacterium]|jgi:putative peptide zinc metalloprotease protein|nr:putative peptide zinc metalloprotease protein [Gaiellaceae bacterium]